MDTNTLQRQITPDDKSIVAKKLAQSHYSVEPNLQRVVRITASTDIEVRSNEPIKLLEVNSDTVPAGVLPICFGPVPASGIPYSSVIVEVTPEEFAKIQAQELKLPRGWSLGEEYPRPPAHIEAE